MVDKADADIVGIQTGDNTTVRIELGSSFLLKQRRTKYRNLAELNRSKNKLDAARRCCEKALYISMNIGDSDELTIAMDLESLGTILYMQGKLEAAQAIMLRAKRLKDSY